MNGSSRRLLTLPNWGCILSFGFARILKLRVRSGDSLAELPGTVALHRPGGVAKRPEQGLERARSLLVSYLGLKAWRRGEKILILKETSIPSLTFGNARKRQWVAGLSCGPFLSSYVVVRRDICVISIPTYALRTMAIWETSTATLAYIAIIVEFWVISYPKSYSTPNYARRKVMRSLPCGC